MAEICCKYTYGKRYPYYASPCRYKARYILRFSLTDKPKPVCGIHAKKYSKQFLTGIKEENRGTRKTA